MSQLPAPSAPHPDAERVTAILAIFAGLEALGVHPPAAWAGAPEAPLKASRIWAGVLVGVPIDAIRAGVRAHVAGPFGHRWPLPSDVTQHSTQGVALAWSSVLAQIRAGESPALTGDYGAALRRVCASGDLLRADAYRLRDYERTFREAYAAVTAQTSSMMVVS